MVHALGFSLTRFEASAPGRLCRGRERWVDGYPSGEGTAYDRVVISGATFTDDTARDASRGLEYSTIPPGRVLDRLFPDTPLLAFCEQGREDRIPGEPVRVEPYRQPLFGGRQFERAARWRTVVRGEEELDPLLRDELYVADGFVPWKGELSDALEQALFLLTGFQHRQEYPIRRYQAPAIPEVIQEAEVLVIVHLDKHGLAMSLYGNDLSGCRDRLPAIAEQEGVLPVPFTIPPMLARWDRALYELRMRWRDQGREDDFPVPPGRRRRRRRGRDVVASYEREE